MLRYILFFCTFFLAVLAKANEVCQIPPPPVVVVEVTAGYCAPCQLMKPVINNLRLKGYPIVVLDAEDKSWDPFFDKHKVRELPCFLMFVDGRVDSRITGWTTEKILEGWLKTTLQERFGKKSDK